MKKINVSKKQVIEWSENGFIFIAHILLLKWILFLLANTGALSVFDVFLHFTGIGIFGAVLIAGSAWIIKRRHKINQGPLSQI